MDHTWAFVSWNKSFPCTFRPLLGSRISLTFHSLPLGLWPGNPAWEFGSKMKSGFGFQRWKTYCWWLKSGEKTSWGNGSFSNLFTKVLAPSQVGVWDFFHQQYHLTNLPLCTWKHPISRCFLMFIIFNIIYCMYFALLNSYYLRRS